jgi:hypothetical protein
MSLSPIQVTGACTLLHLPEELYLPANLFIAPSINTGTFTITADALGTQYQLEIFNGLGEKIYSETISDSQKEIYLNNPKAGVYFVRVSYGEKVFVRKMVVQP